MTRKEKRDETFPLLILIVGAVAIVSILVILTAAVAIIS